MDFNTLIVGGGAAGFFTAINLAEKRPDLSIAILERGKDVLQKVKISGGGRCNVTNAELIPRDLSKNYPRGEKALLGPFHTFCTGDMMGWLSDRGVETKIEEDGRVFPASNDSQTIIDCFLRLTKQYNIKIIKNCRVDAISFQEENKTWSLLAGQQTFVSQHLVVATGSIPKSWDLARKLGHKIIHPVPSLFTFNIRDERIEDLQGISVSNAHIKIPKTKLEASGPLLITHWGLSGPAILRLSAWGAQILNEERYSFDIRVNWTGNYSFEEVVDLLNDNKKTISKQQLYTRSLFQIPKRLWHRFLHAAQIKEEKKWADLSKKELHALATELSQGLYPVRGKSTFKDEFVTAGGVDLKEVNFKTFVSKQYPSLYFAGEVLNIDAITGGFNFQAAWTGGWLVSDAIAKSE